MFDLRHGDAEFGFAHVVCQLAVAQYLLTIFPSFYFEMMMYILRQYMLEVYDLLFDFDFYR